jgi:hypothetical protein
MLPQNEEDRKENPRGFYSVLNVLEKEDREFVLESAKQKPQTLTYAGQEMLQKLLPELIKDPKEEDKEIIAKIPFPILFKAAAKAKDVQEEDLIKRSEIFLMSLKIFETENELKVPKVLKQKLIQYSLI